MNVDAEWIARQVEASPTSASESPAVSRLRALLQESAVGFAQSRPDVESAVVIWPRRGLCDDESSSFLRALDSQFAMVDSLGYVTLPAVRTKAPPGRYALLSKSGSGVSINLEYLIQIGAAAELALDHGWDPGDIDFERGEFDCLALSADGSVLLAVEAKARVTGQDSLKKMLASWLRFSADPTEDLNNNAGRKYRELLRLCGVGPIVVWLVADGARWTMLANLMDGGVRFHPVVGHPTRRQCQLVTAGGRGQA